MQWLKKAEERIGLIHALESTIAAVGSFYLCYYISSLYDFPFLELSGLWGSISAFMVLGAIHQDVLKAAYERVLGTTIAAVLSLGVIYLTGYSMLGLAMTIFLSVIVLAIIKHRVTYRTTCIAIAVIFIVGIASPTPIPPWMDCVTRLLEACVGVVVAIAVVYLFHPIRHRIG